MFCTMRKNATYCGRRYNMLNLPFCCLLATYSLIEALFLRAEMSEKCWTAIASDGKRKTQMYADILLAFRLPHIICFWFYVLKIGLEAKCLRTFFLLVCHRLQSPSSTYARSLQVRNRGIARTKIINEKANADLL